MILIDGKFQMNQLYGGEHQGLVYAGRNIKSNEEVMIRLESLKEANPSLQFEAKV
jgi:hypothetical protein